MKKNTAKYLLLALSLLAIACGNASKQEAGKQSPNIIFILADDLGWADVGYNGNPYHETPHLDRLAGKGILLTNAYANAANCAPTRACILSGQYTPRHGVLTVGASDRGDKKAQQLVPVPNKEFLDTATFSMAEMFRTADYHTAFLGKWHIGNHQESSPLAHGFHYTIGGWKRGSPKSYFSPYQNPALPDGPKGEHLTDRLTDEAIKYMEARSEQPEPFFLYLSYYAVHAPFQAKEELIDKYKKKTAKGEWNNPVYAAMIETLDQNVGRLHRYLEASGQMENTILVFWSDNGGSFRATVNTPLKGAKGMPYEGGIRVPAFFYSPSYFPEPKIVDEPVISTDLYPTFAALANAQLPSAYPLDGADLLPLIEERTNPERALYWYAPIYLPGNDGYAFRMCPSAIIRKGDYKLIWQYADDQATLYNLQEDISENNDLALKEPEIARALLTELQAWHEATSAKIPKEQNILFDQKYSEKRYPFLHY